MDLDARNLIEQRATTLRSLLDAPGGPFGTQSGDLGKRLAERWRLELRLIDRVLEETPDHKPVGPTLELWQQRTEAFVESSESEAPAWTDRQGQRWQALAVLEVLSDLEERLSRVPGGPGIGDSEAAVARGGTSPAGASRATEPPAEGNAGADAAGGRR